MKTPKLKPYNKKLDYSYTLGIFPTIELFKYAPDKALKVIFHSDADKSDGASEIRAKCEEFGLPYEVNDHAIGKIAHKENTYAIGIFEKFQKELSSNNHVCLVSAKNMGNIGTIIRTMIGLGVNNLALIRPSADIFDPKVVRSAMGAFFQMNFKYYDDFEAYKEAFPLINHYPFMLDGATSIHEVEFTTPFSLVMGNESQGLPNSFSQVGQPVFIPQVGDIDSFNLSVSTAIALWEAMSRNNASQ